MPRLTTLLACALLGLASCGPPGQTRVEIAESINEDKVAAREQMDAGNYEVAMRLLEPHESARIRDPQVHRMLGECHWRVGDYEAATQSFERALRIDYGDSETHLALGQMLMEMGRTGRALTELELAVQYGERAPLPYYNYGLALFKLGRVEDAIAQWETAHQIEPANPDYSAALAMGYAGRDDVKALEHFERAANFGADDVNFHNNYGLLLMRMNELERARTRFERALALEPDNESIIFNLATLDMKAGDFAPAAKRLESLHRIDETDHRYRIYLAKAWENLHSYERSVGLLEDWVEHQDPGSRDLHSPGLDEALAVLAMSYRGLGDTGRASAAMKRAIALAPNRVSHLINYGVMLAESGNIEEARAQWQRVLELEPDNELARENLSATARQQR